MTSLTVTATFTRKLIIGAGAIVGASLLLLIVYNIGVGVYKSFFPEKPPSAFIAFGKLPPIILNEGFEPPEGVVYRIETVTGELEELALDLKVFAIELPEAKFGDAARTNSWAETLGFQVPAVTNVGGIAIFLGKDDGRTLKLGTTSKKGTIESDYFNNLTLISEKHRGEEAAITLADQVVKVFGLKTVEYPKNKISYVMYKIDNGQLVETAGLSTANLIQVNYFRGDIDRIPIVYPKEGKSKVWVLTSNKSAVSANVDITMIQPYKFSTYPLLGINKAFEELKAGRASYNKEFDGSVFDIREVVLGYLDTAGYQPYLQPVYVFKSNDNLAAYVSAVADSYIKN